MTQSLGGDVRARLAAQEPEKLHLEGFREAAVLVPLLMTEVGLELLFTVRSGELSSHAGQVAFPGGRVDRGETVEEAARRETFEEVGIEVARHQLVGYLDDHPSPALYVVTPVVALLEWPQELTLNPAEVASVFTAPLDALYKIDPRTKTVTLKDMTRTLHYYPYKEQLIWGLTGNVMKNLLELLRGLDIG